MANEAVTFGQIQAVGGDTIAMRAALGVGLMSDVKVSALVAHSPLADSDFVLIESAVGLLRHVTGGNFVRPNVVSTINEVGYPWTVTVLDGSGGTISPTYAGNTVYHCATDNGGVLDIVLDTSEDGMCVLQLTAGVGSLTFNTTAPDAQYPSGGDAPSEIRTLTIERVNGVITVGYSVQ